jgi:hypothetical protein
MQPAFQISGDDLTMFYKTLFCSNICLTMMHRANMEVVSQKGFASIELWLCMNLSLHFTGKLG